MADLVVRVNINQRDVEYVLEEGTEAIGRKANLVVPADSEQPYFSDVAKNFAGDGWNRHSWLFVDEGGYAYWEHEARKLRGPKK